MSSDALIRDLSANLAPGAAAVRGVRVRCCWRWVEPNWPCFWDWG
jgi:hypothetical protein